VAQSVELLQHFKIGHERQQTRVESLKVQALKSSYTNYETIIIAINISQSLSKVSEFFRTKNKM